MEPWGVHSFENEDAREWSQAYREMGLPVAASTLDVALGDAQNASLSSGIACRAVAAIEAVAYALGRGSEDAQEAFQGAPDAEPNKAADLIEKCNEAITVITGGSGLSAYWKEKRPDGYDGWMASMDALQARVNGGPSKVAEASEVLSEPRRSTTRPPEQRPAGIEASLEEQLADIRNAISGLEADVEVLRQEMREGLIELARHISRVAQ